MTKTPLMSPAHWGIFSDGPTGVVAPAICAPDQTPARVRRPAKEHALEQAKLESLLKSLRDGRIDVDKALHELKGFPFHDLGFAKVDHHRSLRKGFPEVIFCQNKAPEHVLGIIKRQREAGETVFGTRASPALMDLIAKKVKAATINRIGRCFWIKSPHWKKQAHTRGSVLILSAGTADAPVTEEARCTVEILGHPCVTINDVGVAGIHRLFAHKVDLDNASVLIVIAGMEGALPSVVSGYVGCPVIGVPTSVGYGSHMGGLVPLFAMLNSCASGMTVVNIDNGFGAACAAVAINRMGSGHPSPAHTEPGVQTARPSSRRGRVRR